MNMENLEKAIAHIDEMPEEICKLLLKTLILASYTGNTEEIRNETKSAKTAFRREYIPKEFREIGIRQESKADARSLRYDMMDIAEERGYVTVYDLYTIEGLTTIRHMHFYGWYRDDLDKTSLFTNDDGSCTLHFPIARRIREEE